MISGWALGEKGGHPLLTRDRDPPPRPPAWDCRCLLGGVRYHPTPVPVGRVGFKNKITQTFKGLVYTLSRFNVVLDFFCSVRIRVSPTPPSPVAHDVVDTCRVSPGPALSPSGPPQSPRDPQSPGSPTSRLCLARLVPVPHPRLISWEKRWGSPPGVGSDGGVVWGRVCACVCVSTCVGCVHLPGHPDRGSEAFFLFAPQSGTSDSGRGSGVSPRYPFLPSQSLRVGSGERCLVAAGDEAEGPSSSSFPSLLPRPDPWSPDRRRVGGVLPPPFDVNLRLEHL